VRRSQVGYFLILLAVAALGAVTPALSQPAAPPEVPPYEPTTARGAPACPDMGQTLRSSRMLSVVDLPAVRKFYAAHGPECAWSHANAEQLVNMVKAAPDHGLSPDLFHPQYLGWADHPVPDDVATDRDILMTDAALKYAKFVSRGLSASEERDLDEAADRQPDSNLVDGLMDALYSGNVEGWLTDLAPRYPAYVDLQAALVKYRNIAETGGWNQLPLSIASQKRRARAYAELRTRLFVEGDLAQDNGSARMDDDLRDAVIRFQERNGLRADGNVTLKTVERLNISVGERIASLSLNLERLRVSLRDQPATRIDVNLPAAMAVLYRDGEAVLSMNVVVGAVDHETPELSSIVDTIVLNPTWTVPNSIIQNEIRPILKKDKKYLKRNHMYWLKDQLVQEPGAFNALGQIKFDFPNKFSVYLHDTPARKLFTDPERTASHGCVRLERPLELAVALLEGDSSWDRETLSRAIATGLTKRILLKQRMPVVIGYQTAFADRDGTAYFRPDIYGRDTKLTLALEGRVEALKSEPLQW
jgi:murein L,D-transpeptidase YcbB/YkuD